MAAYAYSLIKEYKILFFAQRYYFCVL